MRKGILIFCLGFLVPIFMGTYSKTYLDDRPKRFRAGTINLTVGGGTSRVVNFPTALPDSDYEVLLTPQANFGTTRYWISEKTTTNFTIGLSAAINAPITFAAFEK